MKLIIISVILSAILFGCKKSNPSSHDPDPAIKMIVGKWKRVAYEKTVNGKKTWEEVDKDSQYNFMIFRYDGVILDSNGLPSCCAPAQYYVNGVVFKVVPKSEVPVNPSCAFVDCVGCASWNIEQTGNELILELCLNFPRSKFVRV